MTAVCLCLYVNEVQKGRRLPQTGSKWISVQPLLLTHSQAAVLETMSVNVEGQEQKSKGEGRF